jgi:hypothetical protein
VPSVAAAGGPAERPFSFSVRLSLRDFHFEAGAAVCAYRGKASPVSQPLELRIKNPFFLPEFEYVKSFFAKALGNRQFSVAVSGRRRGRKILELTARCPALERIDEALIRVVRYQSVRKWLQRPEPEVPGVDQSLFTAEEIFTGEEPDLGNVFRLSDRELLAEFIADTGVRNRVQLEYLAGKLQRPDRGIGFTLRPQFGFVFSVSGSTQDHYVWELLDSHATYVWSFDRTQLALAQQQRYLQEALTQVRDLGREQYRRSVSGHADFGLSIVRHEKANSKLVDGFPRWRVRLEELLV